MPKGTAVLLVLVIVGYAGFHFVPVYFGAWMFYDDIRGEVRFAGTSQRTVEQVRDAIMDLAADHAEPVSEDNVEVSVQVTRDGPYFLVHVYYTVPVNLRFYQHQAEFDWFLSGETFAE